MANVKITDLAALTNPASTDVLPIVDVGADVTKKVSIADLLKNAGSGTVALPGIAFDGDPDTGISRPGENQLAISTNGTERARIDSSGRLLVGTSSARSDFSAGTLVQLEGVGSGAAGYAAISNNNLAADGAGFYFARSRGTSNGSNTIVLNNDTLGGLFFHGADGTDLASRAGSIECQVDGTPGANDMPGRLVFSTTADGASSPTERMRINSDGNISFGSLGYGIDFSNTVSIKPSDGLISFGMDGREEYVTATAGCYIYSGSGIGGTTLAGDLILQSRSNQSRSITFVTGSTPAKRMEIAGNGDVTVVGAFSKGSGSFRIDHPLPEKKETHHLVHSFIEGPQADLIYRGHVQLVNGVATVNLDEAARMTEGTFEALCTNVCCFTSNESDWTAVRGSVSGNTLTIEAQDPISTADVCWMVVGERKDQHMLDTNWTDENGRVITEPLKQQPVAEAD